MTSLRTILQGLMRELAASRERRWCCVHCRRLLPPARRGRAARTAGNTDIRQGRQVAGALVGGADVGQDSVDRLVHGAPGQGPGGGGVGGAPPRRSGGREEGGEGALRGGEGVGGCESPFGLEIVAVDIGAHAFAHERPAIAAGLAADVPEQVVAHVVGRIGGVEAGAVAGPQVAAGGGVDEIKEKTHPSTGGKQATLETI